MLKNIFRGLSAVIDSAAEGEPDAAADEGVADVPRVGG